MASRSRLTLAIGSCVAGLLLAACAPAVTSPAPSGQPSQPGASAPASAPASGGAPAAPEQPKMGGTVILGQRDAPENQNIYGGVFATTVVFGHFYETLVQYDLSKDFRVDYPIIPWLAESWSQDDKTLTLKIRDGAKWHDGKTLTAEDVAWSLEFLRDTKNNFSARSNLANVDKITAEGNSVKLTLTRPTPTQLQLLRAVYIMPKQVFEAGGMDALATKSTGTGPMTLVSMDRNARTVFKKNPNYWRKDDAGRQQPYLDGLQHIHNMDQSTQQAALAAGQIDLFNFTDKAQIDAFQKRVKDVQVLSYQFGSDVALVPNHKSPILAKKEVREALHLIFNRQEIIDGVSGGAGLLGLPGIAAMKDGWSIPQAELVKMPGYRQPKTEDLARAKQLLEQAGLPKDWEMRFLNRATYNSAPQGEQAANQLKSFGLKVKYEPLDDATILKEEKAGNFDIYLELGASPDPTTVYARYHSKGATNYGKISDPDLDALVEKLQTTLDKPEQQKLSRQLQEKVLKDNLTFSLADPMIFTVLQPWMRNYQSGRSTQVYFGSNLPFLWIDADKLPAARK